MNIPGKKLLLRNEMMLVAAILILSIVINIKSPGFYSFSTLFDLCRASYVQLIFGLGLLIVIISGGIDVSFPMVGIFSAYTTITIMDKLHFSQNGIIIPILMAIVIGVILGGFNAFAIAVLGIPTLIATLGTAGIIRGLMLAGVGSRLIQDLPNGLDHLATSTLIQIRNSGGTLSRLHLLIIPISILVLALGWILRRTIFGRSIYALGGGIESARRLGIPTKKLQVRIYLLVGGLAGLGGLMSVVLARQADPYSLAGSELDTIAAVVLGGASIAGGYGSVFGTVLGVFLIALIRDNLILLGISGSWERAAVGALLIIGIVTQAFIRKMKKRETQESHAEVQK